jgi:stringent starvation protein B
VAVTAKRPYLIRAMHEWMTDNGLTPHIVVDANHAGADVPEQYVSDGKIVLNVSHSAARHLTLGNDFLRFEARFGGVARHLEIPAAAVLGIYARESGQGMIFAEEDPPPGDGDGNAPEKPKLRVVK